MDIALLIVGILLLIFGFGSLLYPVISRRVRLIELPLLLSSVQTAVGVAGLALTVYSTVALSTGGPTTSPATTPTSTPTSTPAGTPAAPSVTITVPRDGDSVTAGLRVKGQSRGIAAGQAPSSPPPWLYIVVRPFPGSPDQAWSVQPYPLVQGDGNWDASIFVGQPSDPKGTPFDICAIVSSESLPVGQYGGETPPATARDCVSVTR